MSFSWSGIVNTAGHIISVGKADVDKILNAAGKDINGGIKLFIKLEPVAVTVLTPFAPEAAAIIDQAYVIAENIETSLAPGTTKLMQATGIFDNGVIPATVALLNASGKTVDTGAVNAVTTDLFNAIVAENNAQAQVSAILQDAAARKTIPDPASLAAAESAVAKAVATVKSLGLAIQAAIQTIAPVPAK